MNAEHLCRITTASQTPDGSIPQYFGLTFFFFFFLQPESEKPRCRPPLLMQNRGNLAVMYSSVQFSFLLVRYPHSSDEIHLKKVVNAKRSQSHLHSTLEEPCLSTSLRPGTGGRAAPVPTGITAAAIHCESLQGFDIYRKPLAKKKKKNVCNLTSRVGHCSFRHRFTFSGS